MTDTDPTSIVTYFHTHSLHDAVPILAPQIAGAWAASARFLPTGCVSPLALTGTGGRPLIIRALAAQPASDDAKTSEANSFQLPVTANTHVDGFILYGLTYKTSDDPRVVRGWGCPVSRSEEHTSELQSLMRISYAVFCLKKKTKYRKT